MPVNDEDALPAHASPGWPPRGSRVTELSLHLPSLDEVFMTLTGKPTDDPKEEVAA